MGNQGVEHAAQRKRKVKMFLHAPEGYDCPLCRIASGENNELPWTQQSDVVLHNEHITAFIGGRWWPGNAGHVIVIPNQHIENIYTLMPDVAVHVHEAARRIAIALMQTYGCEGTSTRQHNGPGGNQDVWHYHLHVFPRYFGDELYARTHEARITTPEERLPYAERLRTYFRAESESGVHLK